MAQGEGEGKGGEHYFKKDVQSGVVLIFGRQLKSKIA